MHAIQMDHLRGILDVRGINEIRNEHISDMFGVEKFSK